MIARIGFILSLFFLFGTALPLFAQSSDKNNFDVTVSPTFLELTAKPGKTLNQSLKLRNNTDKIITITPEIKIMGGDERGELTIKEKKEDYLDWMKLSNDLVNLKPREWTTVNFTIDIPENAAFGYYWALTFSAVDEKVNTKTGATLTASLAVPILLSVEKDGAKTEGKFAEFKTDSFYYEYPPVRFTTVFQNLGNVHIRPQGNIFIKDFLGKTVSTLNINEAQGGILPNLNRTFESVWNDGFITYEPKIRDGVEVVGSDGKPETEMKIHYQKLLDLRIGKYTATALVLVSGADRDYTYEKSVSFFVFPWKVILALIVIVIFVGIGLFTTGKSIIRKTKRIFGKK